MRKQFHEKKYDTPETIAELDADKSNLLLEAFALIATGDLEQAIEPYALAAPMEEKITAFYKKQGEAAMTARHRFSVAICYALCNRRLEGIGCVAANLLNVYIERVTFCNGLTQSKT